MSGEGKMKGFLTAQQVCDLYHITRVTLWRWAAKGKIRQFKDPKSRFTYYLPIANELLTVKDVCYRLGISRRTLYYYIADGRLVPVPGQTKFTEQEISRFEKEQRESLIEIKPVIDTIGAPGR